MERKVQKLFIATGLVISALVASLPLTSYATVTNPGKNCDNTTINDKGQAVSAGVVCPNANGGLAVNVQIGTQLEVSEKPEYGYTKDHDFVIAPGQVAHNIISFGIRSARQFSVMVSAEEPRLVAASNPLIGIPSSTSVQQDSNTWGIRHYVAGQATAGDSYTKVQQKEQSVWDSAPINELQKADFEVGVAINSFIPKDFYSTTVSFSLTSSSLQQQ